MDIQQRIRESLERITFQNREADFRHHSYGDDLLQYEYVRRGDPRAAEEGRRMFEGPDTGVLCDDPVRNYQYLFVASVTLACRFCIEGGMGAEEAFNLSDLYIRQVDRCRTVQEIFELRNTMMCDYTARMQAVIRRDAFSRPVYRCLDYIEKHLQQPLTLEVLSKELGISRSRLSTLFRREIGVTVSEYIRRKRMDTACLLLKYTDFSCLEIAEYLCFSSDAHFSARFRSYIGVTPTEYRRTHFEEHWADPVG